MRRLVVLLLVCAAVFGAPSAADAAAKRYDEVSGNWAGYFVEKPDKQFVTQVSATVVVPQPRTLPPFESGSWVGVGGARTQDLIQAGVAFGPKGNYAWYELLPEKVRTIRNCQGDALCTVRPGDQVDVDIRYLGGISWQIYLTNLGKWAWYTVVDYRSTYSSADWIYEAPTSTYFGVVTLPGLPSSHAAALFLRPRYAINGVEQPLRADKAVRTHATPLGAPAPYTSVTSPQNTSGAFAVCPYRQACPAP